MPENCEQLLTYSLYNAHQAEILKTLRLFTYEEHIRKVTKINHLKQQLLAVTDLKHRTLNRIKSKQIHVKRGKYKEVIHNTPRKCSTNRGLAATLHSMRMQLKSSTRWERCAVTRWKILVLNLSKTQLMWEYSASYVNLRLIS